MKTLIHWSEVSDSHRWLANEYDYPWVKDLSDNDKAIAGILVHVADVEMFSLAITCSARDKIISGVPEQYRSDFMEILLFTSIMTYEEFRHGMALYKVVGKKVVSNDLYNSFSSDDNDWDVYQLMMTVCSSESIQAPLYTAAANRIEHPKFKELILNIRNDEVRHYNALKLLINDLISKDAYHKQRALDVLPSLVSGHVGDMKDHFKYIIEDTIDLLTPKDLLEMVNMKYMLFQTWFGDDNPYKRTDILKTHIKAYQL